MKHWICLNINWCSYTVRCNPLPKANVEATKKYINKGVIFWILQEDITCISSGQKRINACWPYQFSKWCIHIFYGLITSVCAWCQLLSDLSWWFRRSGRWWWWWWWWWYMLFFSARLLCQSFVHHYGERQTPNVYDMHLFDCSYWTMTMHAISYADSCSFTVSYWKKAFHFLMYWSSAWSPEYLGFFGTEVLVSWALLRPSSSMRSWIEVSNLWMGWLGYYAHHIEESIGVHEFWSVSAFFEAVEIHEQKKQRY